MTGSRANLKVFEEEVGVKASRSETPMVGPMLPASTYLAAVHDVGNREIDNAITQYNRDFPHGADWQGHLVSLTSYFGQYLDAEGSTYYQYERCSRTDLLGAKMFDHLRATHGIIQSLDGFQSNFNEFGGTILKNLDWRNVGVAGGSMLACLTEHNIGNLLKNSDIDLFIWGLDTVEAQKKVEHIKHTIAANTRSFSAAYLVERSAGAVTFIPQNGNRGRKVQVILRQFSNPASILASFDLDPVCIYFDGNEVWLSLRAIRAFYTGYTTTMGAICSSFAARIIKYATRGFGILVRPEEGDPGADDLYVEMESILREQEASITTQFFKLPWSGRDNFGAVFKTIKAAELGCWTHAFSSLASLAALWNLAHATGRIGQLMDEVGTASQIYGLYEGSETVVQTFEPEEWLQALAQFTPSLSGRRWTVNAAVWKTTDITMTQNPLLLLVILPHGLRQYITWALDFDNLTRMRDTGDIRDPDGGKWEVCVWSVSGDKIWQPPIGLGAAIHQLLVTAAMLTAWTVWKVSSGAPWRKMHYGRTLNNALICGYNACDTRTGDFDDWIRM